MFYRASFLKMLRKLNEWQKTNFTNSCTELQHSPICAVILQCGAMYPIQNNSVIR